jgi:LVIVD repeat-containing protein
MHKRKAIPIGGAGPLGLAIALVFVVAGADAQHPGGPGHLPASRENMALVSRLQLTNVHGGIADVAAHRGYAYLNAFLPECAALGGAGTGVHIVDIRRPSRPRKVGFIAAHPNSYVGEGIHIVRANTPFFRGDILIHNNETCDSSQFAPSGASLWDVTDPLNPKPLMPNFGDPDPAMPNQTYHTTHSAQLFVQRGVLPGGKDRVIATLQDNQDVKDVDIFDVSDPRNPRLLIEQGLEDWPAAQGSYANGDTVFHHDMQHKRIGGRDFLLISYWDAGQVLLDITNPANPVFKGDSDYPQPDPLMPQFRIPEGNSHQSYWSSNNKFILSTDEDFSPTRTSCRTETGANAGATPCGEFSFSVPLTTKFPGGFSGTTVWGGSGCVEDANGNGTSDRAEVPLKSVSGADAVVFSRGTCFFSVKIQTGELAGYDMVIIGQSHGGSRAGLLPDAFLCGSPGSPVEGRASATCIGHRAMHQLFNDTPAYVGPEAVDIAPIGTRGERFFAQGGVFDGWGYIHLHDARDPNLRIIDSYAVSEALDKSFADEDHGILSVHEVKTDPRRGVNLAYVSYYNAGARVLEFGRNGLREVGHFIDDRGDQRGSHFWGTFPVQLGDDDNDRPYLLFSDRDYGLYILRFTGDEREDDGDDDDRGDRKDDDDDDRGDSRRRRSDGD